MDKETDVENPGHMVLHYHYCECCENSVPWGIWPEASEGRSCRLEVPVVWDLSGGQAQGLGEGVLSSWKKKPAFRGTWW